MKTARLICMAFGFGVLAPLACLADEASNPPRQAVTSTSSATTTGIRPPEPGSKIQPREGSYHPEGNPSEKETGGSSVSRKTSLASGTKTIAKGRAGSELTQRFESHVWRQGGNGLANAQIKSTPENSPPLHRLGLSEPSSHQKTSLLADQMCGANDGQWPASPARPRDPRSFKAGAQARPSSAARRWRTPKPPPLLAEPG